MNTMDRAQQVALEEAEALEAEGLAVAPVEVVELLQRYNELNIEASKIKAEKDAIKDLVTPVFSTLHAKALTFGGRVVVALSSVTKRELDMKRLAAEHPEIDLNEYLVTKKSTRFDVKKV